MGGRMMAGRGFGTMVPMLEAVMAVVSVEKLAVHFHDTWTIYFKYSHFPPSCVGGCLERKTPLPGYICHRCKVPGHFIQHCPMNGDPNYDIKRVKHPMGKPKSMLMATPDGSYALSSGVVAVLKPNEYPRPHNFKVCVYVELQIYLQMTCYRIRRVGKLSIASWSQLPVVQKMLEVYYICKDSAQCSLPKAPSPALSATAREETMPDHCEDHTHNIKEKVNEGKAAVDVPQPSLERSKATKNVDVSEAVLESMSVREPISQGSGPLAEEEVQQNLPGSDPGKKKKKKVRVPANGKAVQMAPQTGLKLWMLFPWVLLSSQLKA